MTEKAHCPVCRGRGENPSGHPRFAPHKCRACEGSGEYPNAMRVAGLMTALDLEAITYSPSAAMHRDGMLMSRLAALGVCSPFSRSGDNAQPLTDFGREVLAILTRPTP